MKKILVLTLLSVVISVMYSCNRQQVKKDNAKILAKPADADSIHVDSIRVEAVFEKFKSLYSELLKIKSEPDFKKYGFAIGGKYNQWLIRVQEFRGSFENDILFKSKQILVGELEMLGLAYVNSKGDETENTKYFNDIFSKAISPAVPASESESGSAKYDKIKQKYKLFGKWKVSNESARWTYVFEIYKKESEYIGVIVNDKYIKVDDKYKYENLEKKGNRYYIKGSTADEYYLIDSSKNLSMFDKHGDLADIGFKCTKIE